MLLLVLVGVHCFSSLELFTISLGPGGFGQSIGNGVDRYSLFFLAVGTRPVISYYIISCFAVSLFTYQESSY